MTEIQENQLSSPETSLFNNNREEEREKEENEEKAEEAEEQREEREKKKLFQFTVNMLILNIRYVLITI